jgi:hypothetical protein
MQQLDFAGVIEALEKEENNSKKKKYRRLNCGEYKQDHPG